MSVLSKLDILVRETFLDIVCLFFVVSRKIKYFGSNLKYENENIYLSTVGNVG